MTTTTGDPSTLKTPASLSGGDLVSRLLAATPPYLYNVPLTPHSFFFSEMLRSFVQAKTEANGNATTSATSNPRRRKRTWRDARDRPLELTTKDRPPNHENHHLHHQPEKYFHMDHQQISHLDRAKNEVFEENKMTFEQKPGFSLDTPKPEEIKPDFTKDPKNYFDHRTHRFEPPSESTSKAKPEELQTDRKMTFNYEDRVAKSNDQDVTLADQKKLDFSRNFLPRGCEVLQGVKGFNLPGTPGTNDFLPGPLWYPTYPMPPSYPGIDPLHFFIDLRVSGHIWDRKVGERQVPFKGKHCSAFSVPQSREFGNRPLNLTRDEAQHDENTRGTNYILKNLTRTYKDIDKVECASRTSASDCEDSGKDLEVDRSSMTDEDKNTIGLDPPEDRLKDVAKTTDHEHGQSPE